MLLSEIVRIGSSDYIKSMGQKGEQILIESFCSAKGHNFQKSFENKIYNVQAKETTITAFNETCSNCSELQMYSLIYESEKPQFLFDNYIYKRCNEAIENKKEVYFEFDKWVPNNNYPVSNFLCSVFGHDYDSGFQGTTDAVSSDGSVDGLIKKFKYKITFEYGFCNRCEHLYGRIFPINMKKQSRK